MSHHKRIKVDFVALHFREFLPDMMMMTPIERGAYSSLCFKIYDEGGWLPNSVQILSSICGLSEVEFMQIWGDLKRKFIIQDGEVSQKRCLEELQKSEKLIQNKRRAGLMSGKARHLKSSTTRTEAEQRSNSVQAQHEQRPNKTGTNENVDIDIRINNDNSNTKDIKERLNFLCKKMSAILKPSRKDSFVLAEIIKFLSEKNPQYLVDAIEWLKIAETKTKPIAYFIATVKREVGWSTKKDSVKTIGRNISSLGDTLAATKIQGKI
jgi:uncharacterized protein YdaU (DUF1376 family)